MEARLSFQVSSSLWPRFPKNEKDVQKTSLASDMKRLLVLCHLALGQAFKRTSLPIYRAVVCCRVFC